MNGPTEFEQRGHVVMPCQRWVTQVPGSTPVSPVILCVLRAGRLGHGRNRRKTAIWTGGCSSCFPLLFRVSRQGSASEITRELPRGRGCCDHL